MQTNEEIYENVKLIAQAKGLQCGMILYATKREEASFNIKLTTTFALADEFTEKNIQEMDKISSQDDFAFWIESQEGEEFISYLLDNIMENIKEADQNGTI